MYFLQETKPPLTSHIPPSHAREFGFSWHPSGSSNAARYRFKCFTATWLSLPCLHTTYTGVLRSSGSHDGSCFEFTSAFGSESLPCEIGNDCKNVLMGISGQLVISIEAREKKGEKRKAWHNCYGITYLFRLYHRYLLPLLPWRQSKHVFHPSVVSLRTQWHQSFLPR